MRILFSENWDQWQGETYNESEYEPHCEDENFNVSLS